MKKRKKNKKILSRTRKNNIFKFDFTDFLIKNFNKEKVIEKIKQNKILITVFIVSFSLSILMLYTGEHFKPLTKGGDDYYYHLNSVRVKDNILKSPFSFIFGVLNNSFSQNDYIRMGFAENDIDSIFRAPFFIFFWAFVFLIFPDSIDTIWIFNSIIFATSSVLLFAISNRLYKNKKISLFLTLIFIIYPGFHIINISTFTEPFLNLLLLLVIFAYIKSIESNKAIYYFLTGVLIYLSALIKLSIQYLGFLLLIFLVGYIWSIYKNKVIRRKLIFAFIGGIFIIMLPWKFICYRSTGSWDLTTVTVKSVTEASKGRIMWQSSDPYCHGLSSDSGRSASTYFRELINKVTPTRNIWFYYSNICGEAVKQAFYDKPFTFIKNAIKKAIILLTSTPSESIFYQKKAKAIFQYLLGFPYFILHNILVLLALFSIIFPYKDFNKKIILILIVLYHLGIHGFSHVESRYLTTAIPSIILLSGASLLWIKNNFVILIKNILKNRKIQIFGFTLIIFFVAIIIFNFQYINFISIKTINITRKILMYSIFIGLGLFVYLLSSEFISKNFSMLSSILISLVFIITINVFPLSASDYDRWKVFLYNNIKIKQIIYLKRILNLENYDQAVLAIDAKTVNNNLGFKVKINGSIVYSCTNGLPPQTNVLYYLTEHIYKPHQYKWVFIEFDKKLLSNKKLIDIEIIPNIKEGKKGKLIIYGDYNISNNIFNGPSFFRTFTGTMKMNWPYLFDKGLVDTRHIEQIKLSSIKTKSLFIKNGTIYSNDLSNCLGRQYGQYRIRILLKRKGGYYIQERYKNLSRYYFGFVGLVRPLENKIVEWLTEQQEGYIPAPKNVRKYLQTEYDRYYTGYEVF